MNCGVCRTLYPEIIPEANDICGDCRQEQIWEDVDLHDLAVEMEQELEQMQRQPMLAVIEVAR